MYEIEIQKKKIEHNKNTANSDCLSCICHVFAVTKDEEILYLSCTNSGFTSQLVKYRWVP